MTNEIKFNPSLSAAVAAQGTATDTNPLVQQEKQAAPLLGGENVKVSSGAMTDLEKLVARLRSEDDETRTNLAHMRFSAVMSALDAANVRLSQEQATAFATVAEQENVKAELETELAALYAEYGIGPGDNASAVMDAKIKSLEQAVERAIQDGKDHNEAVAKAKEQRERDQAKIDRLENVCKNDEAAIAAAKAALAKARTDSARMSDVQTGIADASSKISNAMAIIGAEKLNEIAAALVKVADGVETPETRTSNAERVKEEEKAIANDPLRAIREALQKIDDVILRTIDENQQIKA